ncbi:hypothetical protein SCP_0105190 [Sparassis crispa]|uniref:EthD domain-containing protein n=1 Tax=Sparassis crispa TaxID=139825 RepID=A0A401G651_9APHY|nr:hypothetical protein SCP_0105190 [Sparassis crispa]GBE77639.1 hypothetical protein SCP_0105190 [Sparassis crispa]
MVVFSEPGSNVPIEEYHDWYNNLHIPGLIDTPVFQTWARWEAIDGQQPSFAATYDVASHEEFMEAWPGLWKRWSGPEQEKMEQFELMDRRNLSVYPGAIHPPSALFDATRPAEYASFVSLEVKPEDEEEFNKWYDEEHIPMLAKVPGWVRSRRFVVEDVSQLGVSVTEQKRAPKYLAVHEWASPDAFVSPELKASISTPLSVKMLDGALLKERRLMKLFRTWERK